MRVTHSMLVGSLLADLDRARWSLERIQGEVASGTRIRRVSDDPIAAATAMRLQARLDETATYRESVNQANDWLQATEQALATAGDVLSRVRELVVRGANETETPDSRAAIAAEVQELLAHLVAIANSQLGDRYLFSGHKTTTPAYQLAGLTATYQGDAGAINRAIGPGDQVTVNVPGDQVFDPAFQALADAINRLNLGDGAGLSATTLPMLDAAIDNVLKYRTSVGALMQRLEREGQRLQSLEIQTRATLSAVVDVDFAEAVLRLRQAETAYQSALAVGARVIQPTLIDFLR